MVAGFQEILRKICDKFIFYDFSVSFLIERLQFTFLDNDKYCLCVLKTYLSPKQIY